MIRRWRVSVTRTGYRETTGVVEAANAAQARVMALEIAPDLEFAAEHESEYEVGEVSSPAH